MTARVLSPTSGPATGTTSTRDTDDDWRHRAACLDEDPELFYPVGETGLDDRMQIAAAKAVCARCPVLDTCLRDALDNRIDHGIWGGLTDNERRAMKRANARRRVSPVVTTKPAPNRKAPAPDTRTTPTDRPACGTDSGYREHTRKHERQCDACRAWKADTRTDTTQPACGTLRGYRRHHDAHETACGPCRDAKAADSAQQRRNQRSTAA